MDFGVIQILIIVIFTRQEHTKAVIISTVEGESKIDQKFCAFFKTPIRYCLKYGEVYTISENLEGIAVWVPGDLADMTIWRLIRSGAIRSGMKMGAKLAKKMKPVFKQLQKDRKENMKGKLFIYLLTRTSRNQKGCKDFFA